MKTKKKKTFEFVVTVATDNTKRHAINSIVAAFARRMPDGCEFTTQCKREYQRNAIRRMTRLVAKVRKEREAVRQSLTA